MYLRILDNNNFGFATEDINEILETDIKITQKEYDDFFELQKNGKQFKLKEQQEKEKGLFGCLEEYIPVIEETKEEYTLEDYALDLEFRLSLIELGGV